MNSDSRHQALVQRLDALERELREVRHQLTEPEGEAVRSDSPQPPPLPASSGEVVHGPEDHPPPSSARMPKKRIWRPEIWMGRVGIGLLLLGVLFLFQFAVEQGWLGPWVRVGFGIGLGGALVLAGHRVRSAQSWFSHLLMGGGCAILFATSIAAKVTFALIPGLLALFLTLLVVALTFVLSVRENSRFLGFFATLGGLLSPLLLMKGPGISTAEGISALLVSAGGMGLYARRGGLELPVLIFILGGLLLAESGDGANFFGDRLFYQTAWLFWGSFLFAGCYFRNLCANGWFLRNAEQAPMLFRVLFPRNVHSGERTGQASAALLAVVPLVWFISACALWNLAKEDAGWLSLILAGLCGLVLRSGWAMRQPVGGLKEVLVFLLCFFGSLAMILILDGDFQLLIIGAFGWAMIQWGIRHGSAWIRVLGNFLLLGTTLWLLIRVGEAVFEDGYASGTDPGGWIDLLMLGLLLSQSILPWRRAESHVYWLLGFPILLLWIAGVLFDLPDQGPWLTVCWSVLAIGLLVAGLRLQRTLFSGTAAALIMIVLGKLFLVDLATVQAHWRVVLFLTLGGAFVVTSYLISRFRASINTGSGLNKPSLSVSSGPGHEDRHPPSSSPPKGPTQP